jgi:hypothetical protein
MNPSGTQRLSPVAAAFCAAGLLVALSEVTLVHFWLLVLRLLCPDLNGCRIVCLHPVPSVVVYAIEINPIWIATATPNLVVNVGLVFASFFTLTLTPIFVAFVPSTHGKPRITKRCNEAADIALIL